MSYIILRCLLTSFTKLTNLSVNLLLSALKNGLILGRYKRIPFFLKKLKIVVDVHCNLELFFILIELSKGCLST